MNQERRPSIPIDIQRQVFYEAGHRCAVCCEGMPLERAHIRPWNKSKDHSAENLICLCANCHSRADHEDWGEAYLKLYKENPCVTRRKDTGDTTSIASLHQVPPPPRDFTGRAAEINELLEVLEHGGVTISGLHGLGGVGKTTLALKLAELLEGRYPDAQFYLDLKGPSAQPTPAADALAHVIRAYHPTAKLPESVDDLRALYLSVLHGQRALLLMDNARDEHQVEPLIPPPGCLLMVTSRFHFTVPGLKVKSLDALLPEDAVKLLLEIAPRIGNHAAEIARMCGNLPLGLRLAASFLVTRANFKVAEYVRKLRESSERLKLIGASLNLSYELLRAELQANWHALSVFPESFDHLAAAAIWELDEEQAQERLGELLNFSLVEWSEETDRYRLHDLARVFADSRMTEPDRQIHQQRHAEHYQTTLETIKHLYFKDHDGVTHGLALFDLERANIEAGQNWAAINAGANDVANNLSLLYPDTAKHVLSLRLHPHEKIIWFDAMLVASRTLRERDAEGRALNNLGVSHSALGNQLQAIEFYEQFLDITRETNDRSSEALALNNLGGTYLTLGDVHRALPLIEQSLAIARETGFRRIEGAALRNLGRAHLILGEIRRAIEFTEQAITIASEISDRKGEALSVRTLGTAYTNLGKAQRAEELFAQSLAINRELGDRLSEGTTLWQMALALDKWGDHEQAIALAETALVILEQIENPFASTVREWLEK